MTLASRARRLRARVRVVFAAAAAGVVAALLLPSAPAAAQAVDTMALREHTRTLSADSLRGRGAGTPGERLAAHYIARQLERLGLKPAGDDFLQSVPLRRVTIEPATRLLVGSGTDSAAFRHGRDFVFGAGGRGAFRDFAGVAVDVGTTEDALALDGGRLRGRVVVARGPLGTEAAELVPRWVAAGVAGVIVVLTDAEQFASQARGRGDVRYFVDAALDDPVWQPGLPLLIAGPAVLRALTAEAASHARNDTTVTPAASGPVVRLRLVARTEALPAANVAALLPGSDPRLRAELVAYTAHYDHLGVGPPDESGDSIYNGFFDNAAGVAMLLAIAQAMREAPPPRSVLFLFFTAEERGLLGSTYYVSHPVRPLERTAAVINLDAGAPAAPPLSWRIDGDSTTLGAYAREIAARHGWELRFYPARPISDHWPFASRGVPTIFLVPGNEWQGVDPEGVAALKERWDHYHQPADEWAPDFPFSGLARYAAFALDIGRAAAAAPREQRDAAALTRHARAPRRAHDLVPGR